MQKMKKLLAVLLCMVMTLSVMACKKADTQEDNSEKSAEEKREESDEKSGEEDSEEREPIVITWGNPSCVWGEGIYTEDYAFLQYVYDTFGIEIEFISTDVEKLQLLASTGDLPDITYMYTSIYPELIASGQLLELSDLIEEYGQDYKQVISEEALAILEESWGGQYCMPILIRNSMLEDTVNASNNGATIRVDKWIEKGAPEFETEEEFLDFVLEWQTEEREATGDDTIFGISSAMNIPIWASYYGVKDIFWYGHEVDVTTGEIRNAYSNPDSAYWKAVEFLNKAWNKGVMDPECFTYSWQDMWDKLQTGKSFMGFWSGMQTNTEVTGELSYLGYAKGPFPYIPFIYNDFSPLGNGIDGARCISANCEYPERVMEFLNWLDTPDGVRTACNGIKGVDWDYDENGQPVMIGEMKAAYERGEGGTYRSTRNFQRDAWNWITSSDQICSDGYPACITSTVQWRIDHATTAQKNFAQYFDESYSYPGQVYQQWYRDGDVKTVDSAKASYIQGLMTAPSDDSIAKVGSAEMVLGQRIAEMVMAEDFAAIKAEIIEQMDEVGYNDAVAEIAEIYKQAVAKYEELF